MNETDSTQLVTFRPYSEYESMGEKVNKRVLCILLIESAD